MRNCLNIKKKEMNKMKDEGYTEAERAAAEWRRQQKLTKVNSSADNRRNMNNNRRNEDRYDSDRNQRHRRSNSRTREIKTDNKDKKDNDKQTPEVDVFGRTILPGRKPSTQASERNDRRSRSPQYSRHRSDSNDHSHSRRSCSRSRSRSRRRKVDMDWNHDKFDSNAADDE